MDKKVYLKSYGCQMNVRDSEVIGGLLDRDGYRLVDAPEKADVVIFNTCAVRQHAEDKVWSEVGRIAKARGWSVQTAAPLIGIVGCMAQTHKEGVFDRAPGADFAVGPSDIHRIPAILKKLLHDKKTPAQNSLFELKIWETDSTARPEEIYHGGFRQDKEHAFVVISEGCSNYCSYCVVPYARGELRHRRCRDIMREIGETVEGGIRRITLLGQNVNSYLDDETGFIELLEKVNGVAGLEEFGFITSHPRDTSPQLFRVIAGLAQLRKYLHLPVQSGSDRVLERMHRGYTRNFYLDLARDYRKIVKGGVFTTDIIVGFPGETEDDFRDTYNLVKEIEFDAAYIFKYSPRPHTRSAAMADDVPKEEKERRHRLVLELQKRISRKKNRKA